MAAYSMERLRVLRDADAGLPSDELAEKYSVSRAWVDRSVGAKPARWRLWRTPILHAQLAELAALIREQPDRTLAELRPAHAGESPHAVPHDQTARLRFKKNGTRVGTRSR